MEAATKVVPWKEKLGEKVKQQQEQEKGTGGQFISLKSGVMSYGGMPVQGNKCDVVALESVHENAYYPDKYGTTDNTSPACYAFSINGDENMAPHPEAEFPQSKTCKTCKHNVFGSADNGRGKGKACSNRRRIAVIPAAECNTAEAIMAAPVAYLRPPPTSVRNWAAYVQNVLLKTEMPLFAQITNVALVPDPKTQIKLLFNHVGTVNDDALLEALYRRAAAEATLIDFPYPKSAGGAEPPKAVKPKTKF
jgi:hypothetical protein